MERRRFVTYLILLVGYVMPGGRPRKPTAIKKLQGNPGKRALSANEPQPLVELPRVPESLSKIARDEWARVAEILYRVRVLTNADLAILRGYCVNFAWAFEAEQRVMEEGTTIEEVRGTAENPYTIKKENPTFSVAQKAFKQMLEFARELGLTPASRTKIQSAPEDTRKPLEKLRNKLVSIKGGKG